MIADVTRVTTSLQEESFAERLARKREEILRDLLTTGSSSFTEGGRRFTLTKAGHIDDSGRDSEGETA